MLGYPGRSQKAGLGDFPGKNLQANKGPAQISLGQLGEGLLAGLAQAVD